MTENQADTPLPTRSSGFRRGEVLDAAGAVVAGIDGSASDVPVVDWAADEAHRLSAPLRLVNAIQPGAQMTSYEVFASGAPGLTNQFEGDAHLLLDAACARARTRHPALDIAFNVPWGPAAAALVSLSDGALCVVVGGPAKGRLERILLGSVALPVIAHAHCPVVVVPAGTAATTLQRIVVGVDGSDASGRAVEFALTTAGTCGAEVTCLLAWNIEVDDGVVVTEPSSARWSAVEQRYTKLGHRTLDSVAARHPDVKVNIAVHHGTPAKVIVEAAASLDSDLVVVGSRGLGGFRGLLLGSVSRRVLEQAGRIVVIVH